VLLLLLGVCAATIGVVAYFRSQRNTTAALLARLPSEDAVVVHIDFDALRRGGILGLFEGSNVVQEPEYRSFVTETGFDYLQDLDSALVSFHRDGTFFLLRGRFDWKSLSGYITRQGGSCYNTFCRVAGSTAERNISFLPLGRKVMALAVSKSDSAASLLLAPKKTGREFEVPLQPVWMLFPAAALSRSEVAFPGTRMFARALEGSERILLAAQAQGENMELTLDALCRSPQEAALVLERLQKTTELLRGLISRENEQPNPRDISGLLAGGTFRRQQDRVFGQWPVQRAFLESLSGGKL
jgi:hypothetical protein